MRSAAAVLAVDRRKAMELTKEIQTAARQLAQCLHQDKHIRTYLEALEESQTDPEASALEKQMYDEYEALIARQQAGEMLSQEDTRSFYELRQKVQDHPLISRRDRLHRQIKPYLNEIAQEISFALGADYTVLAKPH
jgi:cell fate (sporulation/competence/biofilm development) regulator YlbF (YheA/YmcA/DUF963 family)